MEKVNSFISFFSLKRLSRPIGVLLALVICFVALIWVLKEVDRESLSRSWSTAINDPFMVFLVAVAFCSSFFVIGLALEKIFPKQSLGHSLEAIKI